MKVKILRDKDTKEFITIMKLHSQGDNMVFTGDIPTVLAETATMELLKEIYPLKDSAFDTYDNFEIVEYDLIETGIVGADIRNKLSPYKNLIALLEEFFKENVAYATDERKVIAGFIKKEMKQSEESIEYIRKLL